MESAPVGSGRMHRTDQWQSLVGEIVVVWLNGELYRIGLVDDALPDASGLWLASEGAFQRKFIDVASGFEVWTSRYPRSRPRPRSEGREVPGGNDTDCR
ncbi:hypothetical protein [Arthrobacter methylotrophus]|uniref:hypothetical protein n=1 Tax=Arthrobacter methylotrophus TaxID=121291 RepID=UPI0031E5D954